MAVAAVYHSRWLARPLRAQNPGALTNKNNSAVARASFGAILAMAESVARLRRDYSRLSGGNVARMNPIKPIRRMAGPAAVALSLAAVTRASSTVVGRGQWQT